MVDTEEARVLAEGNDMNFLHVNKPEIDLEAGISQYDNQVYEKGKENLEKFIEKGYLVKDQQKNMYISMQKLGDQVQFGVVACVCI